MIQAKIVDLPTIKNILKDIDVIQAIEDGFVAYSKGQVVVPPVGEMIFDNPPGDTHIKYGFIKQDNYYIIKIASGFYDNPKLFGLSSSNGLNLLFSQKTGELMAILLDEGHLTNIRTAAAGAVVAKYLAPKNVTAIGVCGAGIQGRLQVEYLQSVKPCKRVFVWGINTVELTAYKTDMEAKGFTVTTTQEIEDLTTNCNLIITCTPSKQPLIPAVLVKRGTHITAIGSDTSEKQELDSLILQKADRVIVGSRFQAQSRGEVFKAMAQNVISEEFLVEIGEMIIDEKHWRQNDDEITVADLTGVAVQDLQISKAVFENL